MSKVDLELIRMAELDRVGAVKASGDVPGVCGPEIVNAPARGPVQVVDLVGRDSDGDAAYVVTDAGRMKRKGLRCADVFDVMAAKAVRHKKRCPLTKSQVAMGRDYAALSERHACTGVRGSSLETVSGGGGGGGEYIDAVLRDRARLNAWHGRIGSGVALSVRRVRPGARDGRALITDRHLVDAVCIHEKSLTDILRGCGWAKQGKSADAKQIKALQVALAAALDRMSGPVRRSQIMVMRTDLPSCFGGS
jgi:hypothetical protein